MGTVARRVISIPERTAVETWAKICELLSADNSTARNELQSISGIASSLITQQAMIAPIVVWGVGDRVRVYCLYDDDANTGEDSNESSLPHNPTEGDWSMSLPCFADDLAWVNRSLKSKSKRITARDMADDTVESKSESAESATNIDIEGFKNL